MIIGKYSNFEDFSANGFTKNDSLPLGYDLSRIHVI